MSPLAPVDTLARVETPENVWLTFRLAGPWARGAAYLLDLILRGLAVMVFLFVLGLLGLAIGPGATMGLTLLFAFFLEWCYGWFFEAFWSGRTPGKRLLGLRVVRSGGYPVGFYDAMVRNLLRGADVLPILYGVGLLSMLTTRRMQRLGDLAADTIVIEERFPRLRGRLPAFEGIEPFAAHELPGGWRPPERTVHLIDAFFRRTSSLSGARAAEIAVVLAEPIARRLGIDDRDEHTVDPVRFLSRVLITFGDAVRSSSRGRSAQRGARRSMRSDESARAVVDDAVARGARATPPPFGAVAEVAAAEEAAVPETPSTGEGSASSPSTAAGAPSRPRVDDPLRPQEEEPQ